MVEPQCPNLRLFFSTRCSRLISSQERLKTATAGDAASRVSTCAFSPFQELMEVITSLRWSLSRALLTKDGA